MDIRDELTEHIPRLRRYARALIHVQELADDLVQDTLERALGRAKLFQANLALTIAAVLPGRCLHDELYRRLHPA